MIVHKFPISRFCFPPDFSGTGLDAGTGFASSSLLRRHMLSVPIGPVGLVVVDDEKFLHDRLLSLEASARLRRVRKLWTFSFGLSLST